MSLPPPRPPVRVPRLALLCCLRPIRFIFTSAAAAKPRSCRSLFSSSGALLRLRCNGHGRSVVPLPPMPMLLRLRGGESARARKPPSKYTRQASVKLAGNQANNGLTRKESSSGATEASAGHIASAAMLSFAVLCCSTRVTLE